MDSDLATRVDKSNATIGRRYARADEIGVPYAATVDMETLVDGSVTIRERDSTTQIRLPREAVTFLIFSFVHRKITWEEATHKYEVVAVKVEDEEEGEEKVPAKKGETNGSKTVVVNTGRGRFSRPAN